MSQKRLPRPWAEDRSSVTLQPVEGILWWWSDMFSKHRARRLSSSLACQHNDTTGAESRMVSSFLEICSVACRDRPLCSPRKKVKSHRAHSLFKNLKACFLEARRPPICAVKALVHQHGSKRVLEPGFFGDEHQEEILAELHDLAASASDCLIPSRFWCSKT